MAIDRTLQFIDRQQSAYAEAVLIAVANGARGVQIYPSNTETKALAATLREKLPADVNVSVFADLPVAATQGTALTAGPVVVALLPETDEVLPALLHEFLDWESGWLIAPKTKDSSHNKPLFLVSIPKSGTHLLYELARQMGYQDGVELTGFAKPGHWHCLEYSNSHTTAPDFFVDSVRRAPFGNRAHPFPNTPTLFIYRNPLDILVSEANYYHKDGNASFSGYLAGLSFEQRIERLIDDPWLLGSIRERVGRFLPWIDFPNVIPVSYEELVGTRGGGDDKVRSRLIWSLQLKLQVAGVPDRIAEKLFDKESPTFHKGTIGAYRTSLPDSALKKLKKLDQDFIEQLGYGGSNPKTFPFPPLRAEEFRKRTLAFSAVDHNHTPTAVDVCLGCNLVRYKQRYYAIPRRLGEIDLKALNAEQLGGFLSAKKLAELKGLLALGRSEYDQALLRAAQHKTPQIIEEDYAGYNLISFAGKVWAVEIAAGPLDFSNAKALKDGLSDGRLLQTANIDGARLAVDCLLNRRKLDEGLSGLSSIDGKVADVATRLDNQAKRIDARLNEVTVRLEGELQKVAKGSGEGLSELASRLQQSQELLARRLARIAPEGGDGPRIIEENYRGFNLLANGDKVWALDVSAGEVDFADTNWLENLRVSGHLFEADTLDGARVAVLSSELTQSNKALAERIARVVPAAGTGSLLIEQDYRGYNLVAYSNRIWAAEMAAGEIDLADADAVRERLSVGRLLFASSVDGARAQVDRLLDRRAFDEGLARLGALIEGQLKALASRFGSELNQAIQGGNQRIDAVQARVRAVEVLLEGQLKELTSGLEQGLQEVSRENTELLAEMQGHLTDLFEERLKEISGDIERNLINAMQDVDQRIGGVQVQLNAAEALLERRFASLTKNLESGLQQASANTQTQLNDTTALIEQSQKLTVRQLETRLANLERTWWQRLVGTSKKSEP